MINKHTDAQGELVKAAEQFERFFALTDKLDVAYISDSLRTTAGVPTKHDGFDPDRATEGQAQTSAAVDESHRAGWFIFERGCWIATSSDDPRATKLYRAAPTAQQSLTAGGAVTEGYVIVPKVLTEDMQIAASGPILQGIAMTKANQSRWDAMIAAAPLPQGFPQGDSQGTSEALDAARYRHLRDYGDTEGQPCVWIGARWYGGKNGVGFALDDVLDARIANQEPVTEAKRETPSGALDPSQVQTVADRIRNTTGLLSGALADNSK